VALRESTTKTMIHPETGAVLRRRRRKTTVAYMGLTREIVWTGWFPADGGDGILEGKDAEPADRALAEMKAEHKARTQKLAARVRSAAKLTQREASTLLTGSPNSFYKYETGRAEPSWPTYVLLKLLAADPKLIEKIRAV
jgi:HTH-type transcriptional regulator/antitoxin MqsA